MASLSYPVPGADLLTPRTPLVGRTAEVATVRALLVDETAPLLTLTGPGGVGKTRLALAVAHAVAEAFADGIVFVDLSPIREPGLVVTTIAQALGVREADEQPLAARLVAALKSKQRLLVLDNFEQVVEAAPEIAALLAACPAIQVLATSRAPLRVRGEHRFPVEPLPVPAAGRALSPTEAAANEAVALFAQRARAAEPAFALTDQNAAVVAEICRRLDGLPLALELAAARLRLLSPAALLALLSDRLRVLTGGERDLPDRQRTLRDAIAWSHDLLPRSAQALFRRVAVCVGGFDAEATTAVDGGDTLGVLDGLAGLVDQSLVRRDEPAGGEVRFRLLETVREFGLEQLAASGEEVEVRTRHAAWCLDLVEGVWPPRSTALPAPEALAQLDRERDNVRAALAWVIDRGDVDTALRLAGALAEYWWLRGDFSEGRAWFGRVLRLPDGAPRLRLGALYGAAALATFQTNLSGARSLATDGLALAEAHGDQLDRLRAHFVQSLVASAIGDVPAFARHAEVALALAREVGDVAWLVYATAEAADACHYAGDNMRASELLTEAIQLARSRDDQWAESNSTIGFAVVSLALGADERATDQFRRGLELGRAIASPWGMAQSLVGLAAIAARAGDGARAARLLGAVEAVRAPMGFRFSRDLIGLIDEARERAVALLGPAAFEAAWSGGGARSLDQAVAEALGISEPGPSTPPSIAASNLFPPVHNAYALTRRERQVLALLCERLTDAEVAARLFLSVRTVETHVANLLGKLAVPNRREAIALAARLGLA